MCSVPVYFAGNRAYIIANDGAELKYHAAISYLPSGFEIGARTEQDRDMLFLVETGIVEFMVDGASDYVPAGHIVRIRKGSTFAYGNPGTQTARILVRAARNCDNRSLTRVTLEFAA